MTYHFEPLPDAPVIVFIQETAGDAFEEMGRSVPETIALLANQPEPVFLILDLSIVTMDLSDTVAATDMTARGDNPMLHHPNLREAIFVSANPWMQQSFRALGKPAYGMARVSVVETLDEALDYCFGRLGRIRGMPG